MTSIPRGRGSWPGTIDEVPHDEVIPRSIPVGQWPAGMFSNRSFLDAFCSKCNPILYIVHRIAMAVSFPTAPFDADPPTLKAARARLVDVLSHPAFSIERRRKAEQLLLAATSDAQQVYRWAMLALLESERWEDAVLDHEESQTGPPAYPAYPY